MVEFLGSTFEVKQLVSPHYCLPFLSFAFAFNLLYWKDLPPELRTRSISRSPHPGVDVQVRPEVF